MNSDCVIIQVDGADTVSEIDSSDSEATNNIPVTTFMTRANQPAPRRRDAPQVLREIPRNTRINASNGLPVVAVANVRSLLPKLNSFIEKIQNESIKICLISEIWEKKGRKNAHFQARTEEIMEMHGYKYISCGARPSGKRGGGAAILTDLRKFSVEKLEVNTLRNLEIQ